VRATRASSSASPRARRLCCSSPWMHASRRSRRAHGHLHCRSPGLTVWHAEARRSRMTIVREDEIVVLAKSALTRSASSRSQRGAAASSALSAAFSRERGGRVGRDRAKGLGEVAHCGARGCVRGRRRREARRVVGEDLVHLRLDVEDVCLRAGRRELGACYSPWMRYGGMRRAWRGTNPWPGARP
jgi:hypothetical protein